MDAVVKYIDGLLEKSTPDAPVWNIEKIKQGLKSKWNYIDGCMIKAVLQMYDLTKNDRLKFSAQVRKATVRANSFFLSATRSDVKSSI